MKSSPLITISILNYNRENFLDRSLRSCTDQILFNKSYEIIFVDDASTDNSLIKVKSLNIKNLRIIENKKNMGAGYCSNLAVRKAKGKYFIRVDSDDFINKFTLQYLSDILDYNENFGFVCCDHYKVNEKGYKENIIRLNSLRKIKNHGAGIMFRTKCILKVKNYNKKLREAEDYFLISKMLQKKIDYFYFPMPLYRYYIHGKNISLQGNRKIFLKKINDKLNENSSR